MKRRNLVTGALAIVALMAVALAVVPFGATAQRPPQVLRSFNNFKCPSTCAPNADVCCYAAPPIVVVIE